MFRHLRKPNFYRIQSALLSHQPDAVPLIELGIHPFIKEKIMNKPIQSLNDDIQFMSSMGYDFIKIQPHIKFKTNRSFAAIESNQNNKPNIQRDWAEEHQGIIQNKFDFEKYPWPQKEDIDYSLLEQSRNLLPENMKVIGQYGDIYTLCWELMGYENFSIAIYENPEIIKVLFNKIGELVLSMFENMSEMDWVGALWYSDDIAYSTGLLANPKFFREYLFPYIKKIGQLAKKRQIPFIYHSDGLLDMVMPDLIDCGITSLHPIEPKAMNINLLKEQYAGRLALCGNIDVDLLSRGTKDEVHELVKKRIDEIAPGGGYCLGSSNSVPEYVNVENYIEMVKTTLEYGHY